MTLRGIARALRIDKDTVARKLDQFARPPDYQLDNPFLYT